MNLLQYYSSVVKNYGLYFSDYLQSEPERSHFMKQVAARSSKWRELGQELGLPQASLAAIADSATARGEHFQAIFEECTKMKMKKPFTWADIIQALKSPNVGEAELAESLKDSLTYY